VSAEDILKATGLKEGQLDLFDGSPPCQAFSTAGRRERGWGKEKTYEHGARQRNEDLFPEYIRLLRGLMPKAFVAENVSGLVKGVAKGYFLQILKDMKACGYEVEARLLDAQWLGVPQQRQRVIFVGVRSDLGKRPAFPTPLPYRYSVRDACPWLGSQIVQRKAHGFFPGDKVDTASDPSPTVCAGGISGGFEMIVGNTDAPHGAKKARQTADEPVPTVMARRANIEIEGATGFDKHALKSADKPMPTVQAGRPVKVVRASPQARRSRKDSPSPTILASNAGFSDVDVGERRKFTIAELRRICSFPDDFALTGTYAQQWERLGNSVPPVMMYHVACAVRDRVLLA
jgi:DNA (cytosine-5)-methyltransferase 1